jgi:CrcB protein
VITVSAAPSRRTIATAVVIAAGGVIGALARFGIETVWPWVPPEFPWATLSTNLLGCVLIGVLLVATLEARPAAWWVRPTLAVGVIGGFTTFSTLAVEAVVLVDEQAQRVALVYLCVSVIAGLGCVWLSAQLTRRLLAGHLQ